MTSPALEEEAFIQVNTLLLNDLNAKIKASPSRDMTEFLQSQAKTYPTLREVFREASTQSAGQDQDGHNPTSIADERNEFCIPNNAAIIRPFSASVRRWLLKDSDGDTAAIIEALNRLVNTSEVIWHLGSTAVLGLSSALVLKVGNDLDLQHIPTLDYIKQHAPRVPIPDLHGILQQSDSKRTFILMSRVSGEPLDSRWKFLTEEEKVSVQEQLDVIVGNFRSLPAPATHEALAVLGGGSPRRCKDARREISIAPGPISNEQEFNEFITFNPRRTQSTNIAMIRSYLDDKHQIVLAHGDLHPRNIMVATSSSQLRDSVGLDGAVQVPATNGMVDNSNAHITITAILD